MNSLFIGSSIYFHWVGKYPLIFNVSSTENSLSIAQVVGLDTNIKFLTDLARHPSFAEGDVHTGFIEVRTSS